MAAPHPRPLGILRPELPRLRTARLPRCPLQAILRQVLEKKELNFKIYTYREIGHVEFKVAGLAYRDDDASLDRLRSLSSRLCKCCQVLCAVKRGNSRRTP